MSSFASRSVARTAANRLTPADIAFALAWEIHAPGLTGWTVLVDTDEDGSDVILVDPPLAYDNGFVVRREQAGTVVSWANGSRRAGSVRDAMLLICPLTPVALAAAEALAAAPTPTL